MGAVQCGWHRIMNLRDSDQHFMLINVRSLAAYFPMPYKAGYAAFKRMLLDFSLAMGGRSVLLGR